jgi:hypothetical protein
MDINYEGKYEQVSKQPGSVQGPLSTWLLGLVTMYVSRLLKPPSPTVSTNRLCRSIARNAQSNTTAIREENAETKQDTKQILEEIARLQLRLL